MQIRRDIVYFFSLYRSHCVVVAIICCARTYADGRARDNINPARAFKKKTRSGGGTQ